MENTSSSGTTAVSEEPPGRSPSGARPSRLKVLLILGALVILVALALRFSPWAREYSYSRASLESLRLQAKVNLQDPLLFYYLGTKAYNAKSLGEAGYSFERAAALSPRMARAYLGLALVQRDIGQLDQAYAAAKQASTLNPRDPDSQFLLAILVMQQSRARAIPEFEKVTRLSPKRAEGWYYLGLCHVEINQRGEALAPLRKAVGLEPKNALYHRELGQALVETNSFDQGRAELEQARSLAPDDAHTLFLLGELQLKIASGEGDLQKADGLFSSAQELLPPDAQPELAQVAGERALVAKRQRKYEKAAGFLQTARKLDPRNTRYIYEQAEVLRSLGREAEARTLMELHNRLSAEAAEASQLIERIKQDPKDPSLRLRLARNHARNNDLARAVNQYEYCLYLNPRQPEVRRELDALKRRTGALHPGATPSAGIRSSTPATMP